MAARPALSQAEVPTRWGGAEAESSKSVHEGELQHLVIPGDCGNRFHIQFSFIIALAPRAGTASFRLSESIPRR
jgi:hypothetical protein